MSRRGGWLGNALLLAGTLVIALALVEGGLRVFFPQPLGVWHQDRDGLALHWPGLVTYLPQFKQTVSINSVGMRDLEHSSEKMPGVFRVLLLGDSFIEALQVSFEESFPNLLQRELERRVSKRVEVINASVSGWGTDDELKYLTSYGRQWKPDLIVVVMTLYNDVSDNLRQRFHMLNNGTLVERPGTRASTLDFKITELKGFLATHFQLYQLLIRAKRTREMRGEAQQLHSHVGHLFSDRPDERMTRGLELTRLLLERMRVVAAQDGSRVALVLIPLSDQLSEGRFAEFKKARGSVTPGSSIDRPQQQMTKIGGEIGIDVIDLLPAFKQWAGAGGDALYLARDGHWDRPGHRLGARVAGAEIVRLGLIQP